MKTRIFLVAMALVVFASLSFGQGFCRQIYNTDAPLTVNCDGTGGFLPDGTMIYIYWDSNSNGPDASDPLASAIPEPCVVNYDQFALNGAANLGIPGGFVADLDFCSAGCMPSPATFYLRVPHGNGGMWTSATATFVSGPDVYGWHSWPGCVDPQGGVCNPTIEANIQANCGPNNPNCSQSVCLDLCTGHETIVRICGPLGLPIDPAHAPVSSFVPGCNASTTNCDNPCTEAAGFVVVGPLPDPASGCWIYIITGGAQEGCLCFTFEYFLAAQFNNDFVPVAMDNSVKLTWSVASESSLLRYDIVRGSEVVGHVDATNSPTAHPYEFVDHSAVNGTTYSYTLRSVGMDNVATDLATVEGVTPSFNAAVITEYALHQNFPNPFNPTTEIAFDVLNSNPVTLKIYNAAGQEVATLLNSASREGGKRYVINFDATNLTSGLYFYTVKIGSEFSATKKMLLVK